MDLKDDERQNVQRELDFSSAPPGEAQVAGGKETESLLAAHGNERPASIRCLRGASDNFFNRRVRTRTHGGVAGVGG